MANYYIVEKTNGEFNLRLREEGSDITVSILKPFNVKRFVEFAKTFGIDIISFDEWLNEWLRNV